MRRRGFSLIELLIGLSLASMVMVAVAGLAGMLMRGQVEGMRRGTIAGWSALSYASMTKEIEEANVLAYPINDSDAADSILVCKNWSRSQGVSPGGKLESSLDATVIQYCVDSTDPANLRMRRYVNTGPAVTCPAPPAAPVACNVAGPGWTQNDVVAIKLEKLGNAPVFTRDNAVGGVRIRYAIGSQASSAGQPVAKFTAFDFKISMQKPYNSPVD